MTEEMNGKSPLHDHAAEGAGKPMAPNVNDMVENFIGISLTCTLNGILQSLKEMPLDYVIVTTCSIAGKLVGQCLSVGDMPVLFQTRQRCVDAFTQAVKGVPVQAAQPGRPNSAVLPRETRDLLKKLDQK